MAIRISDKRICDEVESAFLADGLPATSEHLALLMALPETRVQRALERAKGRGKLRCTGSKWWLVATQNKRADALLNGWF